VFPIFLAEIEAANVLVPFNFRHNFPDVLHNREKSSQQFINHLRDVITGVVIFLKKLTHYQQSTPSNFHY